MEGVTVDGHHPECRVPKWTRLLQKLTTLEIDLKCSKTKLYAKYQLNISKNSEKCRKL